MKNMLVLGYKHLQKHNSLQMIILATSPAVATIGFTQASYNVIESAGFVTVTVRVTSGTLNRNVVVTLTTADGAAVCKSYRHIF